MGGARVVGVGRWWEGEGGGGGGGGGGGACGRGKLGGAGGR